VTATRAGGHRAGGLVQGGQRAAFAPQGLVVGRGGDRHARQRGERAGIQRHHHRRRQRRCLRRRGVQARVVRQRGRLRRRINDNRAGIARGAGGGAGGQQQDGGERDQQ